MLKTLRSVMLLAALVSIASVAPATAGGGGTHCGMQEDWNECESGGPAFLCLDENGCIDYLCIGTEEWGEWCPD